jgi:PAS domain-containing protein
MTPPSISLSEFRRRAEDKLDTLPDYKPKAVAEGDLLKLVHELQVHKLELEMQNQALHEAHAEISRNMDQLTELYELAPVAYFTLDRNGCISKANAMGRKLLGNPLVVPDRWHLSRFVSLNCLATYKDFLDRVFTLGRLEQCSLTLEHLVGQPSSEVELEGIASESAQECRLVVTAHRQAA